MGEPKDLVGRVLGETYEITHLLGKGGMGAVYAATNIRLDKLFAIKILHSEAMTNSILVKRFHREARIASNLGHPNIVNVIDFNTTDDDLHYMVMEHLEGEDLADRLKKVGLLPLAQAVSIACKICSALHAAHGQNIIHRDMKPENIFLAVSSEEVDLVKVLDFGISKILGSTSVQTREKSLLGTPYYMAPEQAEGDISNIGPWTDIFALGTLIYQMVSGKPAFFSDTLPGLLYKVVHHHPPSAHTLRPDVPLELAAVISKAMSKEPEDRYQSMKELALELRRSLSPDAAADDSGTAWSAPPSPDVDAHSAEIRETAPTLTPSMAAGEDILDEESTLSTFSGSASEVIDGGRAKRVRWLVGGAAAAIAVFSLGVFVLFRFPTPGDPSIRIPIPSQPSPKVATPSPVDISTTHPTSDFGSSVDSKMLRARVIIKVEGSPRGAQVIDRITQKILAKVPGEFHRNSSTQEIELKVKRKGFTTGRLKFTPDKDQTLKVKLRRRPINPNRIDNPFSR